jgi:hypothetical protein
MERSFIRISACDVANQPGNGGPFHEHQSQLIEKWIVNLHRQTSRDYWGCLK